jgi:hypothetical protein
LKEPRYAYRVSQSNKSGGGPTTGLPEKSNLGLLHGDWVIFEV